MKDYQRRIIAILIFFLAIGLVSPVPFSPPYGVPVFGCLQVGINPAPCPLPPLVIFPPLFFSINAAIQNSPPISDYLDKWYFGHIISWLIFFIGIELGLAYLLSRPSANILQKKTHITHKPKIVLTKTSRTIRLHGWKLYLILGILILLLLLISG